MITCKWCRKPIHLTRDGYWEGEEGTSDCAADPTGEQEHAPDWDQRDAATTP